MTRNDDTISQRMRDEINNDDDDDENNNDDDYDFEVGGCEDGCQIVDIVKKNANYEEDEEADLQNADVNEMADYECDENNDEHDIESAQ